MRVLALRMFMVCALALLPMGCDDDGMASPHDGFASDAPQDGGTTSDGSTTTLDRGPPEAGWIPTEQGPVKVNDGGVLVVEDGGRLTMVACWWWRMADQPISAALLPVTAKSSSVVTVKTTMETA